MISEFLRRNSFQSWWNDFERRPPTSFCLFKVSKRSYMVIVICVLYVHLEPQATIYKWLFQLDASKSLYRKWLFHQTSIYKWLFGVPGTTTCFTCFLKAHNQYCGSLKIPVLPRNFWSWCFVPKRPEPWKRRPVWSFLGDLDPVSGVGSRIPCLEDHPS